MKTLNLLILSVLFFSVISCEKGIEENKILGKLPGLTQKYIDELNKLQEEEKNNTNLSKAFELAKKTEQKKEEASAAIKEYMEKQSKTMSIPFIQLAENENYKIKEVRVAEARFNDLRIEAIVEILQDYSYEYFAYMRFIDNNNNPVEGWAVLMSPRNNTAGSEVVMTGIFRNIHFLKDAATVEFRTRDDYNGMR